MAERPVCRECKQASKVAKDKKPMRPGTLWCTVHRKSVQINYTCGQYVKK